MIEHLQENAIEGGGFFSGGTGLIGGELHHGKNPKQTVAKMVDGRIGQHAFQIFLRKSGAG